MSYSVKFVICRENMILIVVSNFLRTDIHMLGCIYIYVCILPSVKFGRTQRKYNSSCCHHSIHVMICEHSSCDEQYRTSYCQHI